MPIPFILGGLAVAAGAFGVKKGLDAKEDMDTAKSYQREAQEIAEKAKRNIEKGQGSTREAIEGLGREKINLLSTSVKDFVENFGKIKNINLQESEGISELRKLFLTKEEFKQLSQASFKAKDIAVDGLSSVATSTLLAYGSYSLVGTLGAASTGAAISGLSGAAATNATLAWLGGGSLATGGLGMAGGMAVLGGIVAGPALAIGGALMASKAKEALYDAESNYDKAREFEAHSKKICSQLKSIQKRANQIENVLSQLDDLLIKQNGIMKGIIRNSGTNWREYSLEDKKAIGMCAQIAKTVKNLIDTSLLKDDGSLTNESKEVLGASEEFLLTQA